MKKLLIPILGLLLIGCSVENDDLHLTQEQNTTVDAFQSFDATVYMNTMDAEDICGTYQTYKFGEEGHVNVSNTADSLYVTITAANSNQLGRTFLHLADDVADFPTVGQGNLPPGQMDHKVSFSPNVDSYTFSFSLAELNLSNGCVQIASNTAFANGGSYWAGDLDGDRGNWSYFEYCLQTCGQQPVPVCGRDISVSLCSSSIDNPTLQGFRNYFRAQIILFTDLPLDGTYDPTMAQLLEQFENSEDGTGTYTTNYTVNTVECGEVTIEISVEVIHCN